MRVRAVSVFLVFSLIGFSGVSCRRKAPPATPVAQKQTPAQVRPPDPEVTAAVGRLHDAEREWLGKSPEAAAAFQKLNETQAAYQGMIEKFGLFTAPVREREALLAALAAARKAGDPAAIARAEKDFNEAADKVEEAEAVLRSGNPSIQKLYDDWLEARKTFAELRKANESIAEASVEVTRKVEKSSGTNDVVNRGVKEN